MISFFSEKMLFSNRCTRGLMPNLIKKSVTVSSIGGYSMFTCSVWHNSLISSGMWIIDLTSIPQLYKAGRSREQPMKRIDVLQVNTVDMYLQCTFINFIWIKTAVTAFFWKTRNSIWAWFSVGTCKYKLGYKSHDLKYIWVLSLLENLFFKKHPLQDLLSSLNAVISINAWKWEALNYNRSCDF